MAFRTTPLMREIAVVLAIKAVAIAVIWAAFFGPERRPSVDTRALDRHLELPHLQRARGGAR